MVFNADSKILTQINIFDTIFTFVEQYDTNIKNIRVYGILDENNKCNEPLFHGSDVMSYIKTSKKNSYRYFKLFEKDVEILFEQKIPSHNARCNLLTKYGLIRAAGLCKDNIASIALRKFIYTLFNKLTVSDKMCDEIFADVNISMNTPETLNKIKLIEANKNKGFIYFIENTATKNIKIGRTDADVESRLISLQVGNDCELILLRAIECNSRIVEKQLHEKLAKFHIRGEWFNIKAEDCDLIINNIN